MKEKAKKLMVVICTIIMSLSLVACGFDEEDARNYTKAAISILCTGEDNTGTEFKDASVSDYEKIHEEVIDEAVSAFSLDSYNISDETKQIVKEMCEQLFKSARYDVGEVEKNGDDFEVSVTIHPLKLSSMVDTNSLLDDITKQLYNGEFKTEDEVYDKYYKTYAEEMIKALDENPIYGDDYTMSFVIEKNADGDYTASEDAGVELGSHMFVAE